MPPTLTPYVALCDASGAAISASNPLQVSLPAGSGTAVSIADGADVVLGSLADSSSALTVNGLLKAIKALLGASLAVTGSFYQATQPVSGSLTVSGSVSVSNFPATQPVSAAALPLPSGAATAAKQPALGTAGTASTDVLSVQGIAGGTALAVSNTSLANLDVALSTLSLKNQFPTTLGITTKAASLSVALASDQVGIAGSASTTVMSVQGVASMTPIQVLSPIGTWTQSTVTSSASSGTLIASNASRRRLCVSNNSTAILYLYMSASPATTTTANNVIIPPGGDYVMPSPIYTGQITCIWSAANGSAQVTEIT